MQILISLTQLWATYICRWVNDLCLSKSKLLTPVFKLRLFTLWTVHILAQSFHKWKLILEWLVSLFWTYLGILMPFPFLLGPTFSCNNVIFIDFFFFCPAKMSWKATRIASTSFLLIAKYFTVPIWPFISLPDKSVFVETMTLVLTFTYNRIARPAVSEYFQFGLVRHPTYSSS